MTRQRPVMSRVARNATTICTEQSALADGPITSRRRLFTQRLRPPQWVVFAHQQASRRVKTNIARASRRFRWLIAPANKPPLPTPRKRATEMYQLENVMGFRDGMASVMPTSSSQTRLRGNQCELNCTILPYSCARFMSRCRKSRLLAASQVGGGRVGQAIRHVEFDDG